MDFYLYVCVSAHTLEALPHSLGICCLAHELACHRSSTVQNERLMTIKDSVVNKDQRWSRRGEIRSVLSLPYGIQNLDQAVPVAPFHHLVMSPHSRPTIQR